MPGTQSPPNADHPDILDELIAIGMDLARQIQAKATAGELPLEAATIAFDRTARAIRRTINLAKHLDDPAKPRQQRTAARARILRQVEDTIARQRQGTDAETLTAELRERLDAPELEDEIGARPTEDIIADILRDLGLGGPPGLANRWPRRTPADLAALHRHAARPPGPNRAGASSPARPPPGNRPGNPPPIG